MKLGVTLLLCCLIGGPAAAHCALAQRLEDVIARDTGYAPSGTCPKIVVTSLAGAGRGARMAAAFFPASGRIVLDDTLDLDGVVGQSYLLHELVHAAQHRAGTRARLRCKAELEAEAYRIQARFMRSHGRLEAARRIERIARREGRCRSRTPLNY